MMQIAVVTPVTSILVNKCQNPKVKNKRRTTKKSRRYNAVIQSVSVFLEAAIIALAVFMNVLKS